MPKERASETLIGLVDRGLSDCPETPVNERISLGRKALMLSDQISQLPDLLGIEACVIKQLSPFLNNRSHWLCGELERGELSL